MLLCACHWARSKIKSINKYFTLNSFLFGIHSAVDFHRFQLPISTHRGYIHAHMHKKEATLALCKYDFYVNDTFLWFSTLFFDLLSSHMNRENQTISKFIDRISKKRRFYWSPYAQYTYAVGFELGLKFIFSWVLLHLKSLVNKCIYNKPLTLDNRTIGIWALKWLL